MIICNKKAWVVALLFVLSVGLIGYGLQLESHVIVKGGNVDCQWTETSFILKWRHSVEKQYWQEYYQQSGSHLLLYKTFMQTFGAGVPVAGQPIVAPAGYVGLATHLMLPRLNWVVSGNMQGEMIGQDTVLPIYQLVPDYTEIQIFVAKHTRLFWLFKDKCHDGQDRE